MEKRENNYLERMEAADQVVRRALEVVAEKYGSGKGDGAVPMAYHNSAHTKNVLEAARRIVEVAIESGKILESDGDLVGIAAAAHDVEQELGSGKNEETSAQFAEEEMTKRGMFSARDIEKTKRMIMSTVVFFEDKVMKQSASEDYLTKIIADADLCALGQPTEIYWETALALLKEIKKTDELTKEDELMWAKVQVQFLSNHEYYTEEANALFPHKEENIRFVEAKIREWEAVV